MYVETCADPVLMFACPQEVCELDPWLWKVVLMLSFCFPASGSLVNLISVFASFDCWFLFFCGPQEVCHLDTCLWNLVLMLHFFFLPQFVCELINVCKTCSDAVLVFSCP